MKNKIKNSHQRKQTIQKMPVRATAFKCGRITVETLQCRHGSKEMKHFIQRGKHGPGVTVPRAPAPCSAPGSHLAGGRWLCRDTLGLLGKSCWHLLAMPRKIIPFSLPCAWEGLTNLPGSVSPSVPASHSTGCYGTPGSFLYSRYQPFYS